MSYRILLIDGEATFTGETVFVGALKETLEETGFGVFLSDSNFCGYHHLNLRIDPVFWSDDRLTPSSGRLIIADEDKGFNPHNFGLIVVRMGHTLAKSMIRQDINAAVDPHDVISSTSEWDWEGGRSLLHKFTMAADKNNKDEEGWPTIGGRRIPWVIGVSAGQLQMFSDEADRYPFLAEVMQQTLPTYNIEQDPAYRVKSNPIKPHEETVQLIIERAIQLLGRPPVSTTSSQKPTSTRAVPRNKAEKNKPKTATALALNDDQKAMAALTPC